MQQLPHAAMGAADRPHQGTTGPRSSSMMAGRAANSETPGTYAFSQKQFIEPLADYLASIRGPGSSDKMPFKPRPRPTDAASTNLVVTEYDLPRGGQRDVFMLRGDPALCLAARRHHGRQIRLLHRSLLLHARPHRPEDRRGRRRCRSRCRRARDARRWATATGVPGNPAAARTNCNSTIRATSSIGMDEGDRQVRSQDREVHELGDRRCHVRPRSGRQCLAL